MQNGYKAPQFDPHIIPQKGFSVKSRVIYINIYGLENHPFSAVHSLFIGVIFHPVFRFTQSRDRVMCKTF